jgi:transposase
MDDDKHDEDPRLQLALTRYQVISPYLALDPRRGQKRALLEELAARGWPAPTGEPMTVAPETIRTWVRRYRRGGLTALEDKPRPRRGVQVLTPEEIELCAQLKREVPERSLDRIIKILEDTDRVPPDHIRRSTLHRALQELGLSARQVHKVDSADLDRFEADCPKGLWMQSETSGLL